MNRAGTTLVLGCAALLAACGSDFPPGSRLTELRLLALRADLPFAHPGEAVQLTALAYDPEARALEWAFALCTNPRASSVDACLSELDGPFQPIEPADEGADGVELSLPVPEDALSRLPADERVAALIGVAIAVCPGAIERGMTENVPLVCRGPDGDALPLSEFEVGVKRIFVRERDRNANPSLRALAFDGEAWPEDEVKRIAPCTETTDDIEDCSKALRHTIRVETSPAESGVDERGTRFTEQLIVHAYTTAGIFESEVRIGPVAEHVFALQNGGEGSEARLFFVLRDDRGGVDWVERRVRAR